MSRYRLSRQADDDLEAIADWIARQNPAAADKVLDALLGSIRNLARNHGSGSLRDDLRPGLRIFPAKRPAQNYVICYYEIPDGIEVSTVLHSRRDWIGLFERGNR
ncbi:MAG: type II toxin-antitoxin system RelE/ParE family toxin [Planctomycetaceae bacterium]